MTAARKPRETKTEQQRAEEALAVRDRAVDRLQKALAHQRALVADYSAQLVEASRLRDHAAAHPALQPDPEPEADVDPLPAPTSIARGRATHPSSTT